MADPENLVARAYETIVGWLARGHETRTQPLAQFVRDPRMPVVYDANFMSDVRARTPDEIESVLGAADSMYRELGHRQFLWDPEMPIEFEARLHLDGYETTSELILVLEGPLATRGPQVELRPAESDAEWRVIRDLCRLDHVEDLFTRADFRGRGIGTALISACVADARARGAGPILIGARPTDTPKHMYAALGFRPLCVQRNYLKTDPV